MLSFFPRGVLDEILNLIESVSEGFPSYSFRTLDILTHSELLVCNDYQGIGYVLCKHTSTLMPTENSFLASSNTMPNNSIQQ